MRRSSFAGLVVVALAAPMWAVGPAAHAATPLSVSVKVVADHLDNPRGVSIAANGRILVAEAGHGDPNGGKCANVQSGGVSTKMCLGFTGAVTSVQGATVTRVLTQLP